jgi:hypothetical protein
VATIASGKDSSGLGAWVQIGGPGLPTGQIFQYIVELTGDFGPATVDIVARKPGGDTYGLGEVATAIDGPTAIMLELPTGREVNIDVTGTPVDLDVTIEPYQR